MVYPTPDNETERNEAVRSYKIMNSRSETAFDEISNLAAQICDCPVAYVSFIEDDQFWFKSKYGLPEEFKGCPREIAFCSVTVCGSDIVIVPDLTKDDYFKNFTFVLEPPHFAFYCAMPLVTPDGYAIGTICVMDMKPRELNFEQQESLRRLAHQTIAQLEYRRRIIELDQTINELDAAHLALAKEKARADQLLETILPHTIAHELIENDKVAPRFFSDATILFIDIVGFTSFAEKAEPATLINMLNSYFSEFDTVMERFGLEKLKTIGDAYMAVAGVPISDRLHCQNTCLAALSVQKVAEQKKTERQKLRLPFFEFRIGINSGPVIAGLIGRKRFTYDIWGDAVNVAARLEAHSESGRINVSDRVYHQMAPYFDFTGQGTIEVKNKAPMSMYFLDRLKDMYSQDPDGRTGNQKLLEMNGPLNVQTDR
ncbi:adenylate/guanylate cyclase domain-containing protein [Sneathiella sp.]|uniref:adenylate/guanylate cyclase domain-containing protein n=1 Tax=Sneathiella sp. TaxID=1964365 RepID=UPI0039E6542D